MLSALVLLASVATHAPTDLVAVAAASGRPRECLPISQGVTSSGVWTRARVPNLQRYCALLSRAHARLSQDPAAARAAAEEADKVLPGRAAPAVVLARVALMMGDLEGARQSFETALSRDKRAVEHPLAMHHLAVARWRAGHLDKALETYRILVPRASLLPSRDHRARVLLEAAHVAMAVAASAENSALILDEALAYLREAARDPHQAFRVDVALSLVLALDRAGRRAQADAILAEQRSSASWASGAAADYLASPEDLSLMRALALEGTDPQGAAQLYRQYLDGPGGASRFAETASARLARIGSGAATRRRNR